MKKGEVRFSSHVVDSGAEVVLVDSVDFDEVIQLSSPVSSGIWIANRRIDVRSGSDSRAQLFGIPRRIPLGEHQRLWCRNETKSSVIISVERWLRDGVPA